MSRFMCLRENEKVYTASSHILTDKLYFRRKEELEEEMETKCKTLCMWITITIIGRAGRDAYN